jgi:ribosomal protein L11 methyltransferase
MPFYEIEFPLTGWALDAVEAALQDAGSCSVTLVDRGDEPVLEPRPGEVRLWSDTLVRALFDAATEPAHCLGRLAAVLGPGITRAARVRIVADQIWERAWMVGWTPRSFGPRLWVCPTAAPPPQDPDAVIVRLDPGLAFGTGTHATTALCLEVLAALDLGGKRVLDYGCGSGLLAIAALKLGAAHAVAVDIDPQALLATRDNALRNAVSDRLETVDAGAAADAGAAVDAGAMIAPADCVLANILAGALLGLRPHLTAACKPGADLVLSGILRSQAEAVVAAYSDDFERLQPVFREDWCCIHAVRRRPEGQRRGP